MVRVVRLGRRRRLSLGFKNLPAFPLSLGDLISGKSLSGNMRWFFETSFFSVIRIIDTLKTQVTRHLLVAIVLDRGTQNSRIPFSNGTLLHSGRSLPILRNHTVNFSRLGSLHRVLERSVNSRWNSMKRFHDISSCGELLLRFQQSFVSLSVVFQSLRHLE